MLSKIMNIISLIVFILAIYTGYLFASNLESESLQKERAALYFRMYSVEAFFKMGKNITCIDYEDKEIKYTYLNRFKKVTFNESNLRDVIDNYFTLENKDYPISNCFINEKKSLKFSNFIIPESINKEFKLTTGKKILFDSDDIKYMGNLI